MWLLYFNRNQEKITYYGFCILEPYKVGYMFKDLNKTIDIDARIFNIAEVYLRKGNYSKKETKNLVNYLHSFDNRVDWVLLNNKEVERNF